MLIVAQTYSKELAGLLGVLLTFGLNRYLKSKAKLIYGRRHAFVSLIEEPLKTPEGEVVAEQQTVRNESVIVRNEGREAAKNIEIVFNWRPQSLNIWPVRFYDQREAANKRWSVRFDSLAPGEELNLELFSVNRDIPAILTLRAEDQSARIVEFEFTKSLAGTVKGVSALLLILGVATTFYLIALAVQLIAHASATG